MTTTQRQSQKARLAEPEQVVYEYLDLLLKEVGEQQPEVVVEQVVEVKPEVNVDQVVGVSPDVVPPAEESSEAEVMAPEWADEPFQSLIFRVQGITLAVPLMSLDGILKWEEDAVSMPWQPEWHLGVLPYRDRQMVVIDSVQLLMPEESVENPVSRERGSHILVIGDGRWGLACDSLARPVLLHRDDVQWGGQNPDRAWAAGTLIERLCVLLDIDAVEEIIRHE
jgi:purine-binding chemotaxis protein CheW